METLLDNRYRVIRTLGSGGFGETFLAEDSQMPSNRRCVVKLLRPIHNNPQIYQLVQERFQREAAILEDLGSHTDQIPTLYAYFQSNTQFYVVQEWVEGDTLTAKVQQQGIFSESAVKEILVNLLPVLEYVHSKRIIHRDIKPDNIILRHRDGKPVLIDFGAVRESMGTVVNSQGLPTSSIVIGTPGYMPSEQAAGRPVYSSDLYSLGMTAIYLLTGKQPQELETDPRTGEIVWHRYALSISPTLAGVIDRAIAYHPRERFPTAREMLEALQLGVVNFPATVPYQQPPSSPTLPYQQPQSSPTVPYQQPPVVNTPPGATISNTVAVSPGTAPTPQPVNHHNGNKGVLLGSLIAGGLIGASVVIGFALTRPNQQVTQTTSTPTETTASSTTSSAEPSPSSSPTTTPDTTTNRNVSQNPTRPTSFPFPINLRPSATPTESPSSSNTDPSTSVPQETTPQETPDASQPEVTSEPEVNRPSPDGAVQNYYATINRGEYNAAWNLLAPSFQNNRRLHPNGYLSYLDWWGGQVDSVEVEQVTTEEANADTATVNAKLRYFMKNGKQAPSSVRFSLLWDGENNRWVVSGAR
ncbi:Serine/Threonine protein kinase [Nostoc sp. NIES-3756]|uniref:serine/threonine-protein kinase n=1 Tax=Nostoc sp. NIES-3756 TaxID=1751286 RepID=UPI00071F14A1|nr:serine/threonine-protein kinase [Nostoc sp. NIES-3756]BAT53950.1 Serine/Threonine protein kinase [Nostoc sp. NIES-3756]